MMLETALAWTQRLILFATFWQALELILIRQYFGNNSVWPAHDLRSKLHFFFKPRIFLALLGLQLIACLAGLIYPSALFVIFVLFTTLIASLRFRGTFNGGSDSMTVLILVCLSIAKLSDGWPRLQQACLAYIAFQLILSYFVAGLAKVRKMSWRSGQALKELLCYSHYIVPTRLQKILQRPGLSRALALMTLGFELLFPLVLIHPMICLSGIALGFLFHAFNVWALGLNRFLFAWISGYPALLYCCALLSR